MTNRYPIGTIKKFGGVSYIKTSNGWKYHKKDNIQVVSPSMIKYVKDNYGAKLTTNVGKLYHRTHILSAVKIIKSKMIQTPNTTHKDSISNPDESKRPWWYNSQTSEDGKIYPQYGEFIYTSPDENGDHYGVSSDDVTFEIEGSELTTPIFKSPKSMEGGVHLINGNVDLKHVTKVTINPSKFDDESNITHIAEIQKVCKQMGIKCQVL